VARCEKFISKLQTEDNNDEIDSNEEGENPYKADEEDEYALVQNQGKKSKRAKNKTRTNKFFYVKFF